jgi:peptide/nickel transport system substrate-binding protein
LLFRQKRGTPRISNTALTVAMTAGEIGVTTAMPDQGFEGFRFVGWSLDDTLVGWDPSSADKPSDISPTSWALDEGTRRG